ncbi:MAG: hypothetical protein NTX24_01355 [Candidatus Pacearchaeota archaeon]|nr:hypothetical protein [Candidatus Pacearchaeota archaeon]
MITTIQIDNNVKSKLDHFKIHPRETYNELIARLMEECKGKMVDEESLKETIEILSDPETLREIAEGIQEFEQGKGKTLEEVEKKLGIRYRH